MAGICRAVAVSRSVPAGSCFLGAGRLAVAKEVLTDLVGRADPGGTLGGD
jgi:hypothetical protein